MIRKDTDLVPKNQFLVCICGFSCHSCASVLWHRARASSEWLVHVWVRLCIFITHMVISIGAYITNKSHKWAYSRSRKPIDCNGFSLVRLELLSASPFSSDRGAILFHSISLGITQYLCRMSLWLFWRHEMANLWYSDTHTRPNNKNPTAKSLWFFSFNRTNRHIDWFVWLFVYSMHWYARIDLSGDTFTTSDIFTRFRNARIDIFSARFHLKYQFFFFRNKFDWKKCHFLPNQMLSFAWKAMRLSMHDLDKQSHIDASIWDPHPKISKRNVSLTFLQMRRFSTKFLRREWRQIKTKHFPNSYVQYKVSLII